MLILCVCHGLIFFFCHCPLASDTIFGTCHYLCLKVMPYPFRLLKKIYGIINVMDNFWSVKLITVLIKFEKSITTVNHVYVLILLSMIEIIVF